MFFFALGITLNCIIWEPLACLAKLFVWPGANRVILEETETGDPDRNVPKTVEEMRKLIIELGQQQDHKPLVVAKNAIIEK